MTVRTVPGADVTIRLVGHADGGHRWVATTLPDGIELLRHEFAPLPPNAPPGASADELFVVRSRTAGTHRLTFELRRPWESDQIAPAQSITVTVIAAPERELS